MTGIKPSDVAPVARTLVGFLEEAPGVKSSMRLAVVVCLALAASVTAVMDWYVIRQTLMKLPIDPNVLLALVAGIGAFISSGAVAMFRRTEVDKGGAA